MSDRPTISIYANESIAHIGYYQNWRAEDLFYEAVALLAIFGECSSLAEVRNKMFGRQDISYSIEPEVIVNTQENLKWLESCSEYPILVDVTHKQIYVSYGIKKQEELAELPRIESLSACYLEFADNPFFLNKTYIDLHGVDFREIKRMFLCSKRLQRHLSIRTREYLERIT